MISRLFFFMAFACLGCSSSGEVPVALDDSPRFCELTRGIDKIYAEANGEQLSPVATEQVAEKVIELAPLIPAGYSNDYRLRYWPVTDVSGLDTSGTSAQRSYDRMQSLFDNICGPG